MLAATSCQKARKPARKRQELWDNRYTFAQIANHEHSGNKMQKSEQNSVICTVVFEPSRHSQSVAELTNQSVADLTSVAEAVPAL